MRAPTSDGRPRRPLQLATFGLNEGCLVEIERQVSCFGVIPEAENTGRGPRLLDTCHPAKKCVNPTQNLGQPSRRLGIAVVIKLSGM